MLYQFLKLSLSLKNSGIWNTLKKSFKYLFKKKSGKLKKYINLSDQEKKNQENTIFPSQLKISIITPLYNTPEKYLKEMIESVISQTYKNWELCLADGSDNDYEYITKTCENYSKTDERIKYKKLKKNYGISENSNKAIEMSSGEYLGILDHDDLLHPSAIYEAIKVICKEKTDFVYSDEATFSGNNILLRHHKPDFTIDYLRSCNYICHFSVFSRKIIDKAGIFRKEFDGSQDYDLFLRFTENTQNIIHIPKILYFWRFHKGSVSYDINTKIYAIEKGQKAIIDHLKNYNIISHVEIITNNSSYYRVKYFLTEYPLITIIILSEDNVSVLKNCINSIIEKTTYKNYEIIIIENNSSDKETFEYYNELKKNKNIKIIYCEDNIFNYSQLNNYAFQYADGDHLVFLHNDIEIITPCWIEEMLMFSQRADVGAVGIKLYYNKKIQHAGIFIGINGSAGYIYSGANKDDFGYMGKLMLVQNMSAVSAACIMIKKSVFEEIGYFSPEFFTSFSDIDLCLKIRQKDYLIVWTPFAEAYHFEAKNIDFYKTRKKKNIYNKEIDLFKHKWKKELEKGDPYYNKNFSLERADYYLKNV